MGIPPLYWEPPTGGVGGFDAASVMALALLAATMVACYLAARFAGHGTTRDVEAEAATEREHREHEKAA